METMITPLSTRRAFAKMFVKNKPELIETIKRYGGNLPETPTNGDILVAIQDLVESGNEQFLSDIGKLTYDAGFTSFNNSTGGNYRNVGWVEAVIKATGQAAEMVGQMFGRSSAKIQSQAQMEMSQNALLTEIIAAESKESEKINYKPWIIGGGILLAGGLVFLIIKSRS